MADSFSYKGKDVTIDHKDDRNADVIIDGRVFPAVNHGDQFDMWSCPGAFYMPAELTSLARHIIDYWYTFTDPNTAPPDPDAGHGSVHDGGHGASHHGGPTAAKAAAKKAPATKKSSGRSGGANG